MAVPTVEQLKQKEEALKQAAAGLGDTADAAKRRALGKRLRRVQRKRRRAVAEAARTAAKAKADEAPPAEAQEAAKDA